MADPTLQQLIREARRHSHGGDHARALAAFEAAASRLLEDILTRAPDGLLS